MRRIRNFMILAALCTLLLAAGCGKTHRAAEPRPDGKLAVAGFTNPIYNWQLLAGYLEVEGKPVPDGTLSSLDSIMTETLHAHQVFDYITPLAVDQCEKVVVFEESGLPKLSALKYWVGVGRCIQADFLLVPQVVSWRERVGGPNGVDSPASVAIDLYLINVAAGTMTRARYEETQQALSDNLFTAKKFAKRGGKWVTATRLASDGIDEKLTELGL